MAERDSCVLKVKHEGCVLVQPLAERDFRILEVKCQSHVLAQHETERGSCVLARGAQFASQLLLRLNVSVTF